LDGIVLNAGVLDPTGKVDSIPVDSEGGLQNLMFTQLSHKFIDGKPSWKSIFDINFFSLVYTIQASLPELRKSTRGGKIIMVSSGAAVKGKYGMGPYGASKAAMNSLNRSVLWPQIVVACI